MTEVQGYVKDKQTNEPLIGAHVILEDMYQGDMVAGTVTDATGYFSMEKRPGTVARISYVGYNTMYPLLYTDGIHDYFLEQSENVLGEAVVIGTIDKKPNYTWLIVIIAVISIIYLINK
jgi:hypothetical protein